MSVHPNGTGTGWTNVETVDVDQPHGLDFRYSQHIAIGVRKRMNQEHSAFADGTVGGIHKPGGCAVLGMEITDDCTAPVVGDGTYRGHGLLWTLSKDSSNFGVLWCATKAAGLSTTGDWTVVKLHPDLQWSGQDVTWAGAHEFDASVDISGNVAMDGDLTVDGGLLVDGTVNFADDVAFAADASFDGTVDFGDGVAFGAEVSIAGAVKMDNTSAEFGGTAGLGLFFDPTVQAAAESITLPNGLIIKIGKDTTHTGNHTGGVLKATVTFGTAFPNAVLSIITTVCDEAELASVIVNLHDASTSLFDYSLRESSSVAQNMSGVYWIAIGY